MAFALNLNSQVPMARASILWLMGEYCERVPKIAPDLLRKMAKTFTAEEDIVKLQTVNLAAKLYLTNSKQVCKLLLKVFSFNYFGVLFFSTVLSLTSFSAMFKSRGVNSFNLYLDVFSVMVHQLDVHRPRTSEPGFSSLNGADCCTSCSL